MLPYTKLPEGMPIIWRGVLDELGGFDEAFGEWGGDKEEMVDRLKGLAKQRIFDVRVLTSVMALHQPHVKDPDAWSKAGKKRQGQREARARWIAHYNGWWRPQVVRVKKAWPAIVESARP